MLLQATTAINSPEHGTLCACKGELLLLLDSIFFHENDNWNLAASRDGRVGYIPRKSVIGVHKSPEEHLPFVEAMLKSVNNPGKSADWPHHYADLFRIVLQCGHDAASIASRLSRCSEPQNLSQSSSSADASDFQHLADQFIGDLVAIAGLTESSARGVLEAVAYTVRRVRSFSTELADFVMMSHPTDVCIILTPGGDDEAKEDEELEQDDLSDVNFMKKFASLLDLMKMISSSEEVRNAEVMTELNSLVTLAKDLRQDVLQHALHFLGSPAITELAVLYIKEKSPSVRFRMIRLMTLLSWRDLSTGSWLMQSDLPLVLMSDIVQGNAEGIYLKANLGALLKMFSPCQTSPIPSATGSYIRSRFLPYLLAGVEQPWAEKSVPFMMLDLVLHVHAIPTLMHDVTTAISSTRRLSCFIAYLLKFVDKQGIPSLALDLLVDLLSHGGTHRVFSLAHAKNLVAIAEVKVQGILTFTKECEPCLNLVKAIGHLPHVGREEQLSKRFQSCLCSIYSWEGLPPAEKKYLRAMLRASQQDDPSAERISEEGRKPTADVDHVTEERKVASPEAIPTKRTHVLLQMRLYSKTLKLIQKLVELRSWRQATDPLLRINWVTAKLTGIIEFFKHFNIISVGGNQAQQFFKFDVKDIQPVLEILDELFDEVANEEVARLIVQVLIDMCHVFPPLVSRVIEMDLVPHLIENMKNHENTDFSMFQLCTVLLTRLLSAQRCLPSAVSEAITVDFVRMLIKEIENQTPDDRLDIVENTLPLILVLNLHCTPANPTVVRAFCEGDAPNTVAAYTALLTKGMDPVDCYDYLGYRQSAVSSLSDITTDSDCQYGLLKMYSDMLQNKQSARLLKDDGLKSVVKFTISHLTALQQAVISIVPQQLACYLRIIFRNSRYLFTLQNIVCRKIEAVIQGFEKEEISVYNAFKLLHALNEELNKKTKDNLVEIIAQSCFNLNDGLIGNVELTRGSLSCTSFDVLRTSDGRKIVEAVSCKTPDDNGLNEVSTNSIECSKDMDLKSLTYEEFNHSDPRARLHVLGVHVHSQQSPEKDVSCKKYHMNNSKEKDIETEFIKDKCYSLSVEKNSLEGVGDRSEIWNMSETSIKGKLPTRCASLEFPTSEPSQGTRRVMSAESFLCPKTKLGRCNSDLKRNFCSFCKSSGLRNEVGKKRKLSRKAKEKKSFASTWHQMAFFKDADCKLVNWSDGNIVFDCTAQLIMSNSTKHSLAGKSEFNLGKLLLNKVKITEGRTEPDSCVVMIAVPCSLLVTDTITKVSNIKQQETLSTPNGAVGHFVTIQKLKLGKIRNEYAMKLIESQITDVISCQTHQEGCNIIPPFYLSAAASNGCMCQKIEGGDGENLILCSSRNMNQLVEGI